MEICLKESEIADGWPITKNIKENIIAAQLELADGQPIVNNI